MQHEENIEEESGMQKQDTEGAGRRRKDEKEAKTNTEVKIQTLIFTHLEQWNGIKKISQKIDEILELIEKMKLN